jgi:hypothetical protein
MMWIKLDKMHRQLSDNVSSANSQDDAKQSRIVTTNPDFTEWDQAFPANRLLASATLDRLRRNAHCLVLDGQSYRAPKLASAAGRVPRLP